MTYSLTLARGRGADRDSLKRALYTKETCVMLPFVQIFFSIFIFYFFLFLCSCCCFSNIFRSSGSKKKGSVKGKKGKGKIGGNTKNKTGKTGRKSGKKKTKT